MHKYHFPSSELKVLFACSSRLKTSKFEQHHKPTSKTKEGPEAGSAGLRAAGGERQQEGRGSRRGEAAGGERRGEITRSQPKLKSSIWGKANCRE